MISLLALAVCYSSNIPAENPPVNGGYQPQISLTGNAIPGSNYTWVVGINLPNTTSHNHDVVLACANPLALDPAFSGSTETITPGQQSHLVTKRIFSGFSGSIGMSATINQNHPGHDYPPANSTLPVAAALGTVTPSDKKFIFDQERHWELVITDASVLTAARGRSLEVHCVPEGVLAINWSTPVKPNGHATVQTRLTKANFSGTVMLGIVIRNQSDKKRFGFVGLKEIH